MGRRLRAVAVLLGIGLFAVALLRGAFVLLDRGGRRRGVVVVGSKAFTESIILAEVISQLIEQRAGLRVERRFNLGGTHICFQALRSGAIDLYPEYTGTGLMAILHRPAQPDPAAVLATVRADFASRHDQLWLEPLGFENTYALAVPGALARRLGLTRVGDLRAHPELTLGFATEFLARDDGWPGLQQRYGLAPREAPRSMEAGLMYRAAASGDVDVISAYSTDGRIATMGLVVLRDDLRFFPPYEAVPLVRRDTLANNPRLRAVLAVLAGRISAARMQAMNAAVDGGGRSPADVAREFLATLPAAP